MAWTILPSLLRLSQIPPRDKINNLFQEEYSRRFLAVPVRFNRSAIVLASPNPRGNLLKKELEVILHRQVIIYQCTWSDYKFYQALGYGTTVPVAHASQNELASCFVPVSHLEPTLNTSQPTNLIERALGYNIILESDGLASYLPHLSWHRLPLIKGLELLLPEVLPREHFVPLGWIDGALFCAVDAPEWIDYFTQNVSKLEYRCQFVVADHEAVYQAYKSNILRGDTLITRSDAEVIQSMVQTGTISRTQGDAVMQGELKTGESLEKVLLAKGIINQEDWLKTLASLINVVPLLEDEVPEDFNEILVQVKDLLPNWIVRKYSILPLVQEDGNLLVAFSNIDLRLIDLVAALTHLKVEPRLMDAQQIKYWIDIIYPSNTEMAPDQVLSFHHLLVELGYISEAQYQDVISSHQDNWLNGLIEKEVINESDLVEASGLYFGCPNLSLDVFTFDEKIIQQYPVVLNKFRLLPLFENSQNIWVATDDLFQTDGFIELEKISGRHVWPVLVPYSVLIQVIQRYTQQETKELNHNRATKILDQLVLNGLITRSQEFAINIEDEYLDQAILNNTIISAEVVAQTVAKILNINFEELTLHEMKYPVIDALGVSHMRTSVVDPVDSKTARLITYETSMHLMALPIQMEGDSVRVAFADPLFEPALSNLSLILQKTIIPVITTRRMLQDAIQRTLGRPNLGTTLLTAGMITRNQLNNALDYASRVNIRLGRALVLKRYITEESLYQFLAKQAKLPFFDLSKAKIDKKAASLLDPRFERSHGIVPLAATEKQVVLAIVDPQNLEAIERAKEELGKPVSLVLVSESDLEKTLESLYRNEYLNESVSSLLERSPIDSAYHVLVPNQIVTLVVMAIVTIAWLVLDAFSFLIVINSLITAFYLVFSIYKFRLIFKAISSNLEVPVTDEEVKNLKDSDLPVYTILVPVHREAEVLASILKSLEEIDYPESRLDILVLLEEDDLETIQKFDEVNPPSFIQKIIVPDRLPKTKPKACNYGLIHARGDYVVIFDAEDLAEPDQLKKVVIAFSKAPENVACIQAKLNYYNRKQNILTQWFTVEYSMWFDLLLPGLDADRAPIPLGGTSNHFKTYYLIEAGAWDPYNVTEDADLGIRLFKRGYRTRIVDSTTYEEANSQYNNWIRQRSRWLKGYMQTWLVHMRHPLQLIREIGFRNFMSFQFIVGGTFFTALLNPVYWVLTSLWFTAKPEFIHKLFPGPIFFMGAICLYVGTFVFTYVNVAGAMRRGYYDMVVTALLSPIYWAMSSIASWKGFLQLIFRPHFWEKTRHGLYKRPEVIIPPEEAAKGEKHA